MKQVIVYYTALSHKLAIHLNDDSTSSAERDTLQPSHWSAVIQNLYYSQRLVNLCGGRSKEDIKQNKNLD